MKMWNHQPTTEDLLEEKQDKRDRFGYEVDFDDFEMPLKKNITVKIHEFQTQTAWVCSTFTQFCVQFNKLRRFRARNCFSSWKVFCRPPHYTPQFSTMHL